MRTAGWEHGAGNTLIPGESAPGLHGVVVIVRDDLTAGPSAHRRLVSGHDRFAMVATLIVPPQPSEPGQRDWEKWGSGRGNYFHSLW